MPLLFARDIAPTISRLSQSYSAIMLTGPRQVGKTTVLTQLKEADRTYVTLDDWTERNLARTDPRMFLELHRAPVMIDEAQYAPELFSYIKMQIDQNAEPGAFWLTGSQAFSMMRLAQESLAGRAALLHMPALSQHEIDSANSCLRTFSLELNALQEAQKIGKPVAKLVADFAKKTGRKLRFEIEPGTFLLANCAAVLATVQDMCDTGKGGYKFIKLDSGMTDILRPSIYGAQHPISILSAKPERKTEKYIVVGHCCESGDIITPAAGDPEALAPRAMQKANIGDLCVIGGAGAYCSSMSPSNYNSYPASPEVLLRKNGSLKLIRRRQTLDQILENEL